MKGKIWKLWGARTTLHVCKWKWHLLCLSDTFPVFVNLSIWISAHFIPLNAVFCQYLDTAAPVPLCLVFNIYQHLRLMEAEDELATRRWIFFQGRVNENKVIRTKIKAEGRRRKKVWSACKPPTHPQSPGSGAAPSVGEVCEPLHRWVQAWLPARSFVWTLLSNYS